MIKHIYITLLLAIPLASNAEILPKAGYFDSRITHTKYNPNDVIRVRAKIGFATLIQLEEDERALPQAGIGDAKAWGIGTVENNVFLKPIKINPNTNLILVTNKGRTYTLNLVLSNNPHYIVKMKYDKPKKTKVAKVTKRKPPCTTSGTVNFNWMKWGDTALAPSRMWDDGRFTCLTFNKNIETPVAYQVSSDGQESLINYSFRGDTMVIHGISKEFRLRLGNQVLGLKSGLAIQKKPTPNKTKKDSAANKINHTNNMTDLASTFFSKTKNIFKTKNKRGEI